MYQRTEGARRQTRRWRRDAGGALPQAGDRPGSRPSCDACWSDARPWPPFAQPGNRCR